MRRMQTWALHNDVSVAEPMYIKEGKQYRDDQGYLEERILSASQEAAICLLVCVQVAGRTIISAHHVTHTGLDARRSIDSSKERDM